MKTELITYSVIIPAYQAEDTIEICLNSLLKNTRYDFELIVVDDLSTDLTPQILSAFKDVRLKLIKLKQNVGVARARNLGLKEAKGEYIVFVDSDDYVPANYFKIWDRARKDGVDIAIFNFNVVERDGSIHIKQTQYPKTGNLKQQIVFQNMCIECSEGPWNKLYRSELIHENHLKFDSGIKMWEDMLFFARAVRCAEKIQAYDACSYYYKITGDGLTALDVNKYVKDFLYMNQIMYHYLNEYKEASKNLTNFSVRWLYENFLKRTLTEENKQMIFKDKITNTIVKSKTSNIKVCLKQLIVRWFLKNIGKDFLYN